MTVCSAVSRLALADAQHVNRNHGLKVTPTPKEETRALHRLASRLAAADKPAKVVVLRGGYNGFLEVSAHPALLPHPTTQHC